jgi:hypothetical protein
MLQCTFLCESFLRTRAPSSIRGLMVSSRPIPLLGPQHMLSDSLISLLTASHARLTLHYTGIDVVAFVGLCAVVAVEPHR